MKYKFSYMVNKVRSVLKPRYTLGMMDIDQVTPRILKPMRRVKELILMRIPLKPYRTCIRPRVSS